MYSSLKEMDSVQSLWHVFCILKDKRTNISKYCGELKGRLSQPRETQTSVPQKPRCEWDLAFTFHDNGLAIKSNFSLSVIDAFTVLNHNKFMRCKFCKTCLLNMLKDWIKKKQGIDVRTNWSAGTWIICNSGRSVPPQATLMNGFDHTTDSWTLSFDVF